MCETQQPLIYGINAHGGHARYMAVPAGAVVPLPDELSFEAGAAISCGTGTAWGGLRRAGLKGDQTIAIFGQGPVGLAGTQLAAAMGARVIALDISEERLAQAKKLGAAHTINPQAIDPIAAIRDLTGGRGAHCSLEAAGASEARIQAIRSVRRWGTCALVGVGGSVTIEVAPDLLQKQVTVVGSWTFSSVGQQECARFAAERKLPIDAIFTNRWRLDQAQRAYEVCDSQSSGKGVILLNWKSRSDFRLQPLDAEWSSVSARSTPPAQAASGTLNPESRMMRSDDSISRVRTARTLSSP
jgi:threonine dehydrogenase-like Zn-dependent dehydrogenase